MGWPFGKRSKPGADATGNESNSTAETRSQSGERVGSPPEAESPVEAPVRPTPGEVAETFTAGLDDAPTLVDHDPEGGIALTDEQAKAVMDAIDSGLEALQRLVDHDAAMADILNYDGETHDPAVGDTTSIEFVDGLRDSAVFTMQIDDAPEFREVNIPSPAQAALERFEERNAELLAQADERDRIVDAQARISAPIERATEEMKKLSDAAYEAGLVDKAMERTADMLAISAELAWDAIVAAVKAHGRNAAPKFDGRTQRALKKIGRYHAVASAVNDLDRMKAKFLAAYRSVVQ